jgi:hypothetical protein
MKISMRKDWKEQLIARGNDREANFFLREGIEYLVLGISFLNKNKDNGGVLLEILDDDGNLISLCSQSAEIVDNSPPRNCIVRQLDRGLFIWPPIFFQNYFFDDLSDGVPEVVQDFKSLLSEIKGQDIINPL